MTLTQFIILAVVTVMVSAGPPVLRYWIWLRRFRAENRIARDQWRAEMEALYPWLNHPET